MSQIRGEQVQYNIIQEVSSDPISPRPNQIWMLKTDYTGQPIGLLLSLTYANYIIYNLSYQTSEGTIIRQALV